MEKNKLVTMKTTVTPSVRNDRMEDKDWVVVPMVMLVEGVHNGSSGALYYPADELEKTPAVWNHKPVVVYHPDAPTACDPDILTNHKVGVIMNTKFENGKLKAEAWLDPERMKKVDNRIAEAIEKSTMMELSTGLFTDLEGPAGEWNKEKYAYVAKNYRPDHLALLPDQTGACSVADGAGFLRLNSEQKKERSIADNWAKVYFPILQAAGIDTSKLSSNELSYGSIWQQLDKEIQKKQPKNEKGNVLSWYYLHEVYSDYFIYEGDSGKLFKQSYEVKENVVTITGVAEEVVRVVDYKTVKNETVVDNEKGVMMEKLELIKKLTSNELSGWTEKDAEILNSMNETQLEALIAKIPEKQEPKVENKETEKKEEKKEIVENKESEKKEEVKAENKQAEKVMTADEYINAAPAEIQNLLKEGLRAFNSEKDGLIASILKNEQNPFSKEFLATKGIDELRGLAKLAGVQKKAEAVPMFNYAGQAEPASTNNIQVEILGLPTLNFEQK